MALLDFADDFSNIQLPTKSMNKKLDATIQDLHKKIYKIYQNETEDRYLAAILDDNTPLTKLINGKGYIYGEEEIYNDFLPNIKKSFQTAGVPIHIKSGTELDMICPQKDPSDLDKALKITPLGVFVPELQSIFLAGDRIAEVATNLNISYTNLAYIVRIHEIMHWLFQWKEEPSLTMSISREYEYIEESFANYMTLLWIDWLTRHLDEDGCKTEKNLLDQPLKEDNIHPLKKDAIRFMEKQPEAYAVAVQLYAKCNPFPFDNDNVLPFDNANVLPVINWCFQKNKIKDKNRKNLVGNLRELYNNNPDNYSTNDIITWYKALFA